MRIRFLGTGAAEGIPAINCRCDHCLRARTLGGKLMRERSATLFSLPDYELLVDAPPNIRALLEKNGVDHVDGVFLTHEHYDHVSGLVEFAYWGAKIDLLVEKGLYKRLQHQGVMAGLNRVAFHLVCRQGVAMRFDGFFMTPFAVRHPVPCFGLAIYTKNLKVIYTADSSADLTNYARCLIRDADLLIVNTPFFDGGGGDHLNVLEALRWKDALGAKRLVLTHINHHNRPYDELVEYVKDFEGVQVAYDGLEIELGDD